MPNSFEIKYLYEIYPDTDFTEEFVDCQTIEETNKKVENQMTEDKWGDIRDSTNRHRKIQSTILREYEVKIIVSRNIDVPILEYSDYTTLTTTEGETFMIYDVIASYSKVSGSLNYVVDLKFKRADNNVINHLSSDNVLAYNTATSDAVNNIMITVDNAPLSFMIDSFYSAGSPPNEYYEFTLPVANPNFALVYGVVSVDDYFYLTTTGYNLYDDLVFECKVTNKAAGQISFTTNTTSTTLSNKLGKFTLNLGSEASDETSGNITSNSITYYIYTFIQPFFDHSTTEIDGGEAPQGIKENQSTIEKDVARFKVWLKQSELWKIEYLNYALFDDVQITLDDSSYIITDQIKGISTRKENKSLIDLYEYDIEFTFNNKVVSKYR